MDPPWRCGKHPGFGYDTTTRQRTGGTSITIHQLSNLFFSYHRQKFILLLRTLNLHCIVQETSLFVYQYSILLGSYLQVATSYDDTNSLDDVLLRLACSWRGARRRHHRLAPRPQSVGGNPLSCNRLCEKSNPPFDIRRTVLGGSAHGALFQFRVLILWFAAVVVFCGHLALPRVTTPFGWSTLCLC